jgi:molybdopterin-guanine dinucleotide biosynthesis protein A
VGIERHPLPVLVVNAGGGSKRMGRAKALLPVPPTQTPLILHMIARLQSVVQPDVHVIANDAQVLTEVAAADALAMSATGVTVHTHIDTYPGFAALGGIATGLEKVDGWALLVACDLPLINPALCARLAAIAHEDGGADRWDAVVPVIDGRDEPMHALYHPRCLEAIRALIAADERRAAAFLPHVHTRYVTESELRLIDPDLRSFINVNTPEEWSAALRLLVPYSPSDDYSSR